MGVLFEMPPPPTLARYLAPFGFRAVLSVERVDGAVMSTADRRRALASVASYGNEYSDRELTLLAAKMLEGSKKGATPRAVKLASKPATTTKRAAPASRAKAARTARKSPR